MSMRDQSLNLTPPHMPYMPLSPPRTLASKSTSSQITKGSSKIISLSFNTRDHPILVQNNSVPETSLQCC